MANIYCNDSHQHGKSIAKCIEFNEESASIFRCFVREFFIADIMSALEIGPQIYKKHGFDFVVY